VAETHWLPRGSILQAVTAFGWRAPLTVAAIAVFPCSARPWRRWSWLAKPTRRDEVPWPCSAPPRC
jgi:hypothetical protein